MPRKALRKIRPPQINRKLPTHPPPLRASHNPRHACYFHNAAHQCGISPHPRPTHPWYALPRNATRTNTAARCTCHIPHATAPTNAIPYAPPARQSPHQQNSVFRHCCPHTPTTQIAYVRFSFQRGRHRPLITATQLTAQNAASQSTPRQSRCRCLCHTARHAPGNPAAAVPHRKARSDNPATVVPYHKARPRQSHYRLCRITKYAPEHPRCRLHPIANHTYRLPFVAVFLRVSPPPRRRFPLPRRFFADFSTFPHAKF